MFTQSHHIKSIVKVLLTIICIDVRFTIEYSATKSYHNTFIENILGAEKNGRRG